MAKDLFCYILLWRNSSFKRISCVLGPPLMNKLFHFPPLATQRVLILGALKWEALKKQKQYILIFYLYVKSIPYERFSSPARLSTCTGLVACLCHYKPDGLVLLFWRWRVSVGTPARRPAGTLHVGTLPTNMDLLIQLSLYLYCI